MLDEAPVVCTYLSLYLSLYWVLMFVSPLPPGAQLQVRSLVFLDQQVRLTGFSGGTGTEKVAGGWADGVMGRKWSEVWVEKREYSRKKVEGKCRVSEGPTLLQPLPV